MVSQCSLQEKYNQVRRNYCFYLDVQDNSVAQTLSKRIDDLGLQKEVFLTERVTHIVRDVAVPHLAGAGGSPRWSPRDVARTRADAMLQRIRPDNQPTQPQKAYVNLTVQKAIILLDKIYDTFFTAPRKANVKVFKKHYIKIEFLDKICRPVCKEFDEWPGISLEPNPPKEKKKETPENLQDNTQNINNNTAIGQKMTRKSRPRIKEKEDKEPKAYCEMCNSEYVDAALHRRSPHHLAFVRDQHNFLALDTFIRAGADVATFLDKHQPNGERRSARNHCNGDVDTELNGHIPRRNGDIDDKRHTRCSKRIPDNPSTDDRQYYKVVGVSTKLRSSGGFLAKKEGLKDSPPPTCNGTKPLVVKFRKVRRSELSVLSDEAEQFMFPKRASSTSSTSSEEEEDEKISRRTSPRPSPALERRRLARPLALKEESSEEDGWPEVVPGPRRKRRAPPPPKRARRVLNKLPPPDPVPPESEKEASPPLEQPDEPVSPLREEARCLRWEGGRLHYSPAVEQLSFAFESVPRSEPWYETFRRQDEDRLLARNVPKYFSLYSTNTPKLPYELPHLPPLKPNCCPLSDLPRRETSARGAAATARAYGTRGTRQQRGAASPAAPAAALPAAAAAALRAADHPRKSPREHASTLAMLGSAGLGHRRRNGDDTKSTASEDTLSETQSSARPEPARPEVDEAKEAREAREASERLQQFLSSVFEDAADYELSDEAMESDAPLAAATPTDVLALVSDCDACHTIRDQLRESAVAAAAAAAAAAVAPPRAGRRGRFKKKNRAGWPLKRLLPQEETAEGGDSPEQHESSLDGSSLEPPDDEGEPDEEPPPALAPTPAPAPAPSPAPSPAPAPAPDTSRDTATTDATDDDDKPLQLDVKVLLRSEDKSPATKRGRSPAKTEGEDKRTSHSSLSEAEGDAPKVRKRRGAGAVGGGAAGAGAAGAGWLQPVVRVARVTAGAARRLRSAGRARPGRLR